MSPTFKSALLLASSALTLTSAIPSPNPPSLEARDCGTVVPLSGFWQIFEEDQQRSTNLYPFAPLGSAEFTVSRGNNHSYQHDLIASFNNVPCPPAGVGPYSIEFLYSDPAKAEYDFSGNTLIDMFAINGALPVCTFRLFCLFVFTRSLRCLPRQEPNLNLPKVRTNPPTLHRPAHSSPQTQHGKTCNRKPAA